MAEDRAPPERTNKAPTGMLPGCGAACLTLVIGFVVSWCAAEYAVRHRPARTEVNDALYWDFLWLQWCCGGNLVVVLVAVSVGVFVAHAARGDVTQDRHPHL